MSSWINLWTHPFVLNIHPHYSESFHNCLTSFMIKYRLHLHALALIFTRTVTLPIRSDPAPASGALWWADSQLNMINFNYVLMSSWITLWTHSLHLNIPSRTGAFKNHFKHHSYRVISRSSLPCSLCFHIAVTLSAIFRSRCIGSKRIIHLLNDPGIRSPGVSGRTPAFLNRTWESLLTVMLS